jgi:hypothetical protein
MGQIAPAPQTFRMDTLLSEMREIDARNFHQRQIMSSNVMQQVNMDREWANEFAMTAGTSPMRSESKLTSVIICLYFVVDTLQFPFDDF